MSGFPRSFPNPTIGFDPLAPHRSWVFSPDFPFNIGTI
jgi:hypothetical protein